MSSCKKASPVLGAALSVVLESRRAGGLASISTRSWSVFDSFDRGSFTVLVQLLIMTDQQQTDVFVKFRHLTHERSHSSRKQVCKFCVSGGSSGPEGRLEIGVLSLDGMERGELTVIDVQKIARGGAAKVETKEGTENNCLP